MMIEIQQLKTWAEAERKKSEESAAVVNGRGGLGFGYEAEANAFFRLIQKLDLLLSDKHTKAITEEAHSANTMLGEVCPCCKRPTSETYRASSSETGDVGQNLDKLKPEE